MKRARKLISFLLTMVMVFAMSVTVFAGQEGELEGGSITINNAVEGQTYSIYQILYLESYDAAAGAYAYKANSEWKVWLEGQSDYVKIDEQGYVTWKEGASAAEFAKLAQTYAKEEGIASVLDAVTATSATVSFSGLKLGYYLIDSTLGTLCSLDTTNPNVEMEEKNEVPTNEKTVEEDSTKEYGSVNDADIGQTVNFKSTITLPTGSENVVFHDEMSEGLTLDAKSIKVYTDVDMSDELEADAYTVITSGLTDDCTFEVSFTKTYLDSLTDSTTVYVKYAATVNEKAVVGDSGNPNTSKVSYGDKSNTKTTPDSTTITYTWSFDVLKYANGDENKPLAGAQFVLLSSDKQKVATIVNGKLTGWVNVSGEGENDWTEGTILTTEDDGKIEIAGLDADTYYLREIKAPDGYNKLADDVEVKIVPETADDGKSMTLSQVTAKVENKSGTELPSTGGMGTTVFYALGFILAVGAVILLVTKKRMSIEK